MKKYMLIVLVLTACTSEKNNKKELDSSLTIATDVMTKKDSLRVRNFIEMAMNAPLHSREHQILLDSALTINPENAWLWQQKAMPLYKARKYSLGKPFLEKAVAYDAKKWLDYSGFMKCIFSKQYLESITDLIRAKNEFGDGYVMDHTYNFYIGLDYLQLNEFKKAKEYLTFSKEQQFKDFPNDPPQEACHYLDWFYLGVADFELGNYQDAITAFDMALKVYDNFADAHYFKGRSIAKMGNVEEGVIWEKKAFENGENTFNEDNAIYEIYPYQVFHKLNESVRPK